MGAINSVDIRKLERAINIKYPYFSGFVGLRFSSDGYEAEYFRTEKGYGVGGKFRFKSFGIFAPYLEYNDCAIRFVKNPSHITGMLEAISKNNQRNMIEIADEAEVVKVLTNRALEIVTNYAS